MTKLVARNGRARVLAAALAAVLAVSSDAAAQNGSDPGLEDDAAFRLGIELFNANCSFCHSGTPESLGYGPPLHDIVGRPAADYDVYKGYTEALKTSGLVWTEENLRLWIKDSAGMVPGTNMPETGITEEYIEPLMVYLRFISQKGPMMDFN